MIVCGQINKTNDKRIEAVQRKLLKYVNHILTGDYPRKGACCENLYNNFNIVQLSLRRKCAIVAFCLKLIKGLVNSHELLGSLFAFTRINARSNTRKFYRVMARTNFEDNSPSQRMAYCGNWYINETDISLDQLLQYSDLSISHLVALYPR